MIHDEQLAEALRSYYEAEPAARPDRLRMIDRVLDEVHDTAQDRSVWRRLHWSRQAPAPSVIPDTVEVTSSTQATNGHTPTVIGRTQSMFSPAKAIIAAALVFGLGSALLIAQPFGQQADVGPGAESADIVEPAKFTAAITPGPWVSHPVCEVIGSLTRCRGEAWSPDIREVSDPRLDGEMTLGSNQDKWPGQPWLVTLTYRITNEDGAWQGSSPTTYDGRVIGSHSVVFVGEGEYEGLYAWMDLSDWSAINGVVYSVPPPEAPTLRPPRDPPALGPSVFGPRDPTPVSLLGSRLG